MRVFLITVICLALASPAFSGLYKWTDKEGKLHFSDNLNEVPLDQRNKKHIKKMKSRPIEGKSNLPTAAPASAAPKHLGAKKQRSGNKAGVDKQRVNDLLRLNQKRHYNH